mmetsp:Transcript_13330/g.15283  ORF Transcript_13330/g.15283 Transcript_13330/m.15283 type:complete len:252 (+) Transcript_13330:81-836(+)
MATPPINNNSGAPAWANPTSSNLNNSIIISDEEVNNVLLEPYSTLDEPVLETILRDIRAVGLKLRIVMLPLDKNTSPFEYVGLSLQEPETSNEPEEIGENQKKVIDSLKDWDLWGPLLVCLTLSVILSFKAPTNESAMVFASVFCLVWFGSIVVTINAQLLGGTISFFQSVCVLGYCVFPMTIAAFIIGILRLTPLSFIWFDMLWLVLGFLWATRASSVFIASYIPKERRLLAVYPVLFFYIFLAWIILLF